MVQEEIDVVVFDLGGVFLDWDPRHLYRKLIPDEERRERFLSEVCSPQWHALQDLGMGIVESCRELVEKFPEETELINAWAERNEEMVAGEVQESATILRELHDRGIPCYALSNMEREAFVTRRARFAFMDLFNGFVISGQEGIAKPDESIFQILAARFELNPSRTLFVDDQSINIETAKRLGYRTHLFHSATGLRHTLVTRQILIA